MTDLTGTGTGITAVVIADPDRLQVDRIKALVDGDPEIEILGIASRREDASDMLWTLHPDVAIVDINLLSFTDHPLHGWGPIFRDIRLIAVGPGEEPHLWSRLRAAGFAAYVPASRLDEDLCDVVCGEGEGDAVGARHLTASRSLTA